MPTTERRVATICSDVLRAPVGTDQDLFAAGVSSLSAAMIAMLVARDLGVLLSISDIAEHRTAAALARHVDRRRLACPAGDTAPVTDHGPRLEVRPSVNQRNRLLRDRRDVARLGYRPVQHLYSAYLVRGPLAGDRFAAALAVVCARHDTLRTRFAGPDRALVSPDPDVDLTERTVADATVAAVLEEFRRRPFDLQGRPPWRVGLFHIGAGRSVLSFVFDHLLVDAWSLRLFERELADVYNGMTADFAAPAGTRVAPGYYEFADDVWRRYEAGEFGPLIGELRTALGRDQPVPELRLRDERAAVERADLPGRSAFLRLPAELTEPLFDAAARIGVRPFSCLLTAYVRTLAEWSATGLVNGVVVPVSNRATPAMAQLVGWQANMSFLPTGSLPGTDFWRAARIVEDDAPAIRRRAMIPVSMLIDELAPGRLANGVQRPWAYFDLVDPAHHERLRLDGIEVERWETDDPAAPVVGYYLYAVPRTDRGIDLRFDYSPVRLTEDTADRILVRLRDVLAAAARDLSEREVVTPWE